MRRTGPAAEPLGTSPRPRCGKGYRVGQLVVERLLPSALVVFAVLVPFGSSCTRVERVFADCDRALHLQNAALALASVDEIDPAFEAVGLARPDSVRTVAEAQEHLLKLSAEIGCEDKVHSSYLLGLLYLHQERYPEAVRALETSVHSDPTVDGYNALAEAHEKLGDTARAEEYRTKSRSLTIGPGTPGTPGTMLPTPDGS